MRAVVQRVSRAEVRVSGEVVGRIGSGLLVLLGAGRGDGPTQVEQLVEKIVNLRIFEDDAGKMNRSLLDVSGGLLAVSQFTLYGDARKGRRTASSVCQARVASCSCAGPRRSTSNSSTGRARPGSRPSPPAGSAR